MSNVITAVPLTLPVGSANLHVIGNADLLRRPLIGLFCSSRCSGSLILATHDLADALAARGAGVVGGFHSPVERECLRVLLRGGGPIVQLPARSLEGMRLDGERRHAIAEGRLAIASCSRDGRITRKSSMERNRMVARLAAAVFVGYAEPGGLLEALCRDTVRDGKSVFGWRQSDAGSDDGIWRIPADRRGMAELLEHLSI